MANNQNRVSDLSVLNNSSIAVNPDSEDAVYLNGRWIKGYFDILNAKSLAKFPFGSGLAEDSEDGGEGGNDPSDRPQPSDIQSITKTPYISGGKTRIRVVIKVRNNSGEALVGFDARRSVPTSQGGTS